MNQRFASGNWVYAPVELPVRDLDSRLLLACCAAERGYHAVLGRKSDLADQYGYLPRGMIVDKSLALIRQQQFERLREMGFRLSASEEESIWAYREPEQFLRMRLTERTIELADFYFAWGEEQADLVRGTYPSADRILRTVGTPRFDVTRPEFRALWDAQVGDLQNRYGRFIMLPSNFSLVLASRGGRDFYEKMRERHGGTVGEADRHELSEMLDHFQRNLEAFVGALPKIREAFPQHRLVVRPHPGDDPDFWHKVARDVDGVEVAYEGNVVAWLLAADATFHFGCTTGLESYFLGQAAVAYHPYFERRFDNHLSTDLGPVAQNPATLIDYLRTAVSGEELPRNGTDWLDRYFFRSASELAADRIVDAIDEIELPVDRLLSPKHQARWLATQSLRGLQDFRKTARRRLSGKRPQAKTGNAWDEVSADSIRARLQAYQQSTGRFGGVGLAQLSDQVYYVGPAAGH